MHKLLPRHHDDHQIFVRHKRNPLYNILCAGGGIAGHEGVDFTAFGFTKDNQIITNISK